MFQFRRFPSYAYLIQRRMTEYCSAGFPHSEICGSKPMCGSPQLIAACHVLLRLLMPRHSPCALCSLTSSGQTPYPSLPAKAESSLIPLPLLSDPESCAFVLGFKVKGFGTRGRYGVSPLWFSRIMQITEKFQISAFIVLPFLELPQFLASLCLFCCLLFIFLLRCSVFKVRSASSQASYPSLPGKPKSSFSPLLLLSKSNPLRGFDLDEGQATTASDQ